MHPNRKNKWSRAPEIPRPNPASPSRLSSPNDHCHPERSEGSAFYDRHARSLAKKTHKTTLSSGHGFNRVNNLGAQRLPLGGLPAEPSPNPTIQLSLLIENDSRD